MPKDVTSAAASAARRDEAPAARGLVHELRSRSDEMLASLLTARPDLARPAPTDLETLAARAVAPASVRRAIDMLNTAQLSALRTVSSAASSPQVADVALALDCDTERAAELIHGLHVRGLLWHEPSGYVVPDAVAEAVSAAPRATEPSPTPLEPPSITGKAMDPDAVDVAAGACAGEVLTLIEEIAIRYGTTPPRLLRAGGLSVRDLAATATLTGMDTHGTALLLEIAHAAGLLASGRGLEPVWAPTDAYDAWLEDDDARRWATLTLTWTDMPRAPHAVGTRTGTGTATANALSDAVTSHDLPALRRHVVRLLAHLPPGVSAPTDHLITRLTWERPRRTTAAMIHAVTAVMTEAAILGITSSGALSCAGRALLDVIDASHHSESPVDDEAAAVVAAAARLPQPVEHLLLQSDLTAIVPGRPGRRVAAFLRLTADTESRGGASTFRFSTDSLRRAYDAGWSPEDVLTTLTSLTRTGVPQPLDYLVRDAARGHGTARLGAASSYIRCDDTALLDTLMVRAEADAAQLRRLAPTVVVSPLPPTRLLTLLRQLDLHALVEAPDGTLVASAPTPTRSPTPRRRTRPRTTPADVTEIVSRLRAADASASPTHAEDDATGPTDPAVTLARLREATTTAAAIRMGVVAADGEIVTRHVRPTRVAGGLVHGVDLDTGRREAWSIHRIR